MLHPQMYQDLGNLVFPSLRDHEGCTVVKLPVSSAIRYGDFESFVFFHFMIWLSLLAGRGRRAVSVFRRWMYVSHGAGQ
jgi:hypothetical protein